MSDPVRSMAQETHPREDMDLIQPDLNTIQPDVRDFDVGRFSSAGAQRLIWDNRRFIFRVAVAGMLVSILIALLLPKRFQSTARLMPPDQGSSGLGLAMMAAAGGSLGSQLSSGQGGSSLGSMAGDLLGLRSSSELFVGILQSRTVLDDVINKFDLKNVYSDRLMEDVREELKKNTNITAERKSGIISIQVEDKNPARAAGIAGEYINELNKVVVLLNTSSAHRERVFLEDRLIQVKQDLENAEQNFSHFATKNTALDIPTQGKAMIEAAATLEGELIAAQTELEGLKQVYADGNVRVRTVQARVDELRKQLEKNLGNKSVDPSSGKGQIGKSLYPSMRELPALGVDYADLYRNTRTQEIVFQTLTQQYELAKVQEAKETPSVKVLDSPDVPGRKSFPPRTGIVFVGTILALIMGVLWVLGKHRWDRVEAEDPQKVLALEVINTVSARMPWVATNGSGSSSIGHKVWSRFRRNKEHSRTDL